MKTSMLIAALFTLTISPSATIAAEKNSYVNCHLSSSGVNECSESRTDLYRLNVGAWGCDNSTVVQEILSSASLDAEFSKHLKTQECWFFPLGSEPVVEFLFKIKDVAGIRWGNISGAVPNDSILSAEKINRPARDRKGRLIND